MRIMFMLAVLAVSSSAFGQTFLQVTPEETAACKQQLTAFQTCVEEFRKTAKPTAKPATRPATRRTTSGATEVIIVEVPRESPLSAEYADLLKQMLNANIELSKSAFKQAQPVQVAPVESPILNEILAEVRANHDVSREMHSAIRSLKKWVIVDTAVSGVGTIFSGFNAFRGVPDIKLDVNNGNTITNHGSSASASSESSSSANASATAEGGGGGSGGSVQNILNQLAPPRPDVQPKPDDRPRPDHPKPQPKPDYPPKDDRPKDGPRD